MSLVGDVLSELFSMFVGDARLTAAILAVVAIAPALIFATPPAALAGGALMLLGCLAVLGFSVRAEAARRSARTLAGRAATDA